jgi:hypothetical protein
MTGAVADLRRTGINPNFWYPVAVSGSVPKNKTFGATFAGERIALYRGSSGTELTPTVDRLAMPFVLAGTQKRYRPVVLEDEVIEHTRRAVDRGRQTWCWGRANRGQLGNDSFVDVTVRQAVEHKHSFGVRVITAGARHACSLTPQGEPHCWGEGESGQLGRPVDWSGLPLRVYADR